MNVLGMPVRDLEGHRINYGPEETARIRNTIEAAFKGSENPVKAEPPGFVPAGGATSLPFWQYSIFGSGIGLSNIIIGPASGGGGAREIIFSGGSGGSSFGWGDFWQALRHNPVTGQYDQTFVSPIYSARIMRIVVGNVMGDSQPEIAVMLLDGRIYLYDLTTKAALGTINTGVSALIALSLADLDSDGYAELIAVTGSNLYVFNGAGSLLWQVAGAGGADVIAGQMDNDPAIEIASTGGTVVDGATHAVQWTRTSTEYFLKLAPLPGANYQQLIAAEAGYSVSAYDVAAQSQRWTLRMPRDISAIEIADVDNDGTPELLIGDGQWGTVHIHNLATQALKWEANNPEHGVTNIAVADVDNDGVPDLLWGAGATSSGPDHLYVAETTGTHSIKWQNVDLVGPFLGPLTGDLDGDGQPELVVCTYESEASYDSGRILVFDIVTLALRGMSAPVVGSFSWEGVRDLKLRDLEGDGRMEIVVAADKLYDGVIEIYSFDSSNTFTLKWTNTTRPDGAFTRVEVADLDGNGTPEIIAGIVGYPGVHVYIYDYPSGVNPWISLNLIDNAVKSLVVDDIDGDGSKEIAALDNNDDLYTFDGATRELESFVPQSGGRILSHRSPSGLIKGDSAGVGHFLQYSNGSYTESFSRQLGSSTPDGINVLANGGLWTGAGGALHLRLPPSYNSVDWQSPFVAPRFGRFVATDHRGGHARVFSAGHHTVAGFNYQSSLPSPTPGSLGNISTRLRVETGDNVLIGGFIVTGSQPKKVLIRGIGPSLVNFGIAGALANPTLELRDGSGQLIRSNDDWRTDQQAEIIATTIPPSNNLESAIVETLPAHSAGYTAIIRGAQGGTGIGVVEVYDLDATVDSKLGNISTRGLVQTDENVLIAGTIVLGELPQKVLIRAIGPSLPLAGRLADPILELRDENGGLVRANDNWRSDQQEEIMATTIPPSHDLESAMLQTLPANGASYTAIVRGVGDTTGIAVVEVYALN